MKKLLRTIFFILLLLGGGFLYVVKHPDLPISQKILSAIGVDMTRHTQQNTIDPNCISYFDGCNNCSVKNGRPDACTLMYCETPSEPKCNEYGSGTATTGETVGIANPASTNCVNNWGELNIVTSSDGGQVGMCTFADGSVCEERAYMRGECWTTPDEWEQTVCTMEYAPVCASVQVECIKAPCNPIEETFGNKCMMNANKHATYLHDGECTAK